MIKDIETTWWHPDYEFFGEFYIDGDNSLEGYLAGKKQSLNERVETEVNGVIHLLNLKMGERILDLPCGYGRHSIALAKRGYKVTGCDINQKHLSVAIENSRQLDVDIQFVQDNMLTYQSEQKFDAAINMFYSFGFFETDEENLQTLRNFYHNLASGGKFLFHTDVNLERVFSGKYREYEERILASGKTLEIIDKYDSFTKRINGSWSIRHGDHVIDKHYSVRVYSKDEFCEMCRQVNFGEIQVFGDWDGSPYLEDSEDMIIVAKR